MNAKGDKENELFSPKCFDNRISFHIHLFPFWSCFWPSHSVPLMHNANVESHFRMIKVPLLQHRTS